MKKIFILCFMLLTFLLVSCEEKQPEVDTHTHTFSNEWSIDNDYHWHGSTCEHTDVVDGKNSHDWNAIVTTQPTCEGEGLEVSTCKVCGKTKEQTIKALGHKWLEATYESPKMCEKCGDTEGEPLPMPIPFFEFPELNTFKTDTLVASSNPTIWEYQAKVEGNVLYFYVVQHFGYVVPESDTVKLSLNHVLIKTNYGEFTLCSNTAYSVSNQSGVDNFDYEVNLVEGVKTEYYLRVKLLENVSEGINVGIYSFDNKYQSRYNNQDRCVVVNNRDYHTHTYDSLYVEDRVKFEFKSEELYQTPEALQSPVPEKWGYHMQAANEGLYIYVYQNVSEVVYGNDKWTQGTHIEFSIFHHSFGFGGQLGRIEETYVAAWPDKTYYINNWTNVLEINLERTKVVGNKIEYCMFIRFDNNLDNPKDGPYAFIKVRCFDPTDNASPYSDDDVVEYRDNRFVHTIAGDSLFVYEKINYIDNPYETSYLDSRVARWNDLGFETTSNMTLFIGDSFFESDNWWTNFYNDYQNKACFTSAIGGTKVTQWLNWIPSLIGSFDGNLKNIVIHLGYNDVNSTGISSAQLEELLEELFSRIHEVYPSVNIYYLSIGTSYWFQTSGNARAKETDILTKQFAANCSYVTYVDIDSCYNQFIIDTGLTLQDFFKDGTHPKNENYNYIISALEKAGCVIENK